MADRSVRVVVDAQISGFVSKMRQAEAATLSFGSKGLDAVQKHQAGLNILAGSMTVVGAGLVGMAGFAVKSAMDWEQAWTGVLKTVDGTPAQLSKVEDGLRSLAKQTGFTHEEVAGVAAAAGQLGISTGGITKFTEEMLAMGVSTNLSAEEAATGMARFRNIMGGTEADIGRAGSAIVALGNNFATTEGEVLAMGMRIAGAGRQAHLTSSDVLGLSAAMSSVGIEAEAGGTAMSLTLKRIGKEVDTSGPKLDLFAQTAGMTAKQFQKAWRDDAAGTLVKFVDGLGKTEAAGKSTNAVLTELGVTGIREADALLRLSGNADGLADALNTSADGWRTNNALMNEANKFYGTTAQAGKQAWASIKDSAISAGDDLLPIIAKIFETVAGLADEFGNLPGPVKSALGLIAGVGGVSLIAMAGVIKLTVAIANMRGELAALSLGGSGRAGGVIAGVGKAAAGFAVLSGVMAAGESITARSSKEMDSLEKSLAKLGKTGKATGDLSKVFGTGLGGQKVTLGRDIRSIGEALKDFDKYGDDNFLTRLTRRTVGQGLTGGQSGSIYTMTNTIKDMDAAFVSLSKNDPDAAIKSFEKLRDRALDTGGSVEQLGRAFPKMTELLRGSSEAMGGTSDAAAVLNGDLKDLAPAAQMSAEELAKAQDAARGVAESFFDMGESLKGSLAGFGKSLRDQTVALRDFRKNAAKALSKGADQTLVDYLIEQGPAGAAMLKQLADTTHTEIGKMNMDWSGHNSEIAEFIAFQAEVPDYVVTEFKTPGAKDAIRTAVNVATEYKLTPTEVETIMRALNYTQKDIDKVLRDMRTVDNTKANPMVDILDAATGKIRQIQQLINGMHGKTVRVTVDRVDGGVGRGGGITTHGYTGMRIPAGFAGGGKVPGTPPVDPTEDNVLAFSQRGTPLLVRSGEWVINQAASEKNDRWLRAINNGLVLPAFAGGGRQEYTQPAQAFTAHAFGVGVANSGPSMSIDYDRLAAALSHQVVGLDPASVSRIVDANLAGAELIAAGTQRIAARSAAGSRTTRGVNR